MPDSADDGFTSATRLLAKRREMTEVEHALADQKEVDSTSYSILSPCVFTAYHFNT